MARSTGYTAAKPPGIRSAATAPLVTTPCRSSRVSASACARMVAAPGSEPPAARPLDRPSALGPPAVSGSPYRSGSSDHRPDTVGGPVRVGIAERLGRLL